MPGAGLSQTIDEQTPGDLDIHIIADNYATHKHPAVTRWLDRHPRFHMHYTPTSSSWMSLVERFFRDLTEFITEKSFASTRELADAIIAFLAARNENPQRYVWKAKGEDILRQIDAEKERYFRDGTLVLRFSHLIQLICLRIAGPAVSSRSKVNHLTDSEH